MQLGTEKVIQIDDNKVLTNKGRVFEHYIDNTGRGYWLEVTLPEFGKPTTPGFLKDGKIQFVEPVTDQEKFDQAKNVGDLIQ